MFIIEKFILPNGECPFNDFIIKLKNDGQLNEIKKINHYINLLEIFGNSLLKDLKAKKITDKLYELRPIPNRIFYFYHSKSNKFILLHGFKKKTNKTPKDEIELALKEISIYERTMNNEQ